MSGRGGGLPPRLVLATGNPGKLREMREILAPWHVDVRPLSEFTSSAATRRRELRRETHS